MYPKDYDNGDDDDYYNGNPFQTYVKTQPNSYPYTYTAPNAGKGYGYNNVSDFKSTFNSLKNSINHSDEKLLNYKKILKEENHVFNLALDQKSVLSFEENDPTIFGIDAFGAKVFMIDKRFSSFIDANAAKTLRSCHRNQRSHGFNVYEYGNNYYYYLDYYHLKHMGIILIDSMIIFYAPKNHSSMINQYSESERMGFIKVITEHQIQDDEDFGAFMNNTKNYAQPYLMKTKSLSDALDINRITDQNLKDIVINTRILL